MPRLRLAVGRGLAEGVETMREYEWLAEPGLVLFQGYLIAKPAFESLPVVFPRGKAPAHGVSRWS